MKPLLTFLIATLSVHVFAQPAGSLDPTFGTGGKVTTSITSGQDKAYGLAIQPDGRILAAGHSSSSITGKDFACVRYLSNGNLDSTFGVAGIVTLDIQLGSEDVAYSIGLQTDGKIVLAGYTDNGSNKDAALVRLKANGAIDSTFGVNGKVQTDYDNAQQDEIKVLKIHPLTGNILVGGASIISSSLSKPVVARYLSNGSLDSTFNTTGIRLLWITNLDYQYLFSVEDLIVQPNGKVTAVGWREFTGLSWDSDYWTCRINSDGSMDNTFSNDGVNTYNGSFNGHDRAFALLLNPDNSFWMAGGGFLSTLRYDFTLFELQSSGAVGALAAMDDFGALLDDIAYALVPDNNAKLVLAGTSGNATTRSFAIARKNSDASLDASFGTSGEVTTTFNGNDLNECFDAGVQADNKIVALGYSGSDFAIARYTGNAIPQLDVFQLQFPANNATQQNYTSIVFNWTDAFGATSYELEIDSSISFGSSPQTFIRSVSSFTMTNLQPNTDYYWHVRATDGSNFGQWTATWKFSTKLEPITEVGDFAQSQIRIFPNPSQGHLTIEASDFRKLKSYTLKDLAGKTLLEGGLSQESTNIGLEGLARGTYFLQVGIQGGNVFKVVKE